MVFDPDEIGPCPDDSCPWCWEGKGIKVVSDPDSDDGYCEECLFEKRCGDADDLHDAMKEGRR